MAVLSKTELTVATGEVVATISLNGVNVPVILNETELNAQAQKSGRSVYTNDDIKSLAKDCLGLVTIG